MDRGRRLPYAGTYTGPDAVLTGVFGRLGAEWAGFEAVTDRIVADEEIVIATGTYSGTFKATGRSFAARFAHVWELPGRIGSRYRSGAGDGVYGAGASRTSSRARSDAKAVGVPADESGGDPGVVDALGNIRPVLAGAVPADKSDVYQRLGLRLAYKPDERTVRASMEIDAHTWGFGLCPRGESHTTLWHTRTGQVFMRPTIARLNQPNHGYDPLKRSSRGSGR